MNQGYTVKQWQQMRQNNLSLLQNAVTSLTPFGCLTANALAHLKADWISWRDEVVLIEIPPEDECNSFKLSGDRYSGNPGSITPRNKPCDYCRSKGSKDHFEHLWNNHEETNKGSHTAILHREIAAPAVELLEKIFKTYGREELSATPDSFYTVVKGLDIPDIETKSSIYSKLLRTGPVLYAEYGLSSDEIASITRYQQHSIECIVGRTPGINFNQVSTLGFLRTVNEMEPVTVEELKEQLELCHGAVTNRLAELRKEGRLIVQNNKRGPPPATWETVTDWESPFSCEQCSFETHSLGGIRQHKKTQHDI